VKRRERAKKNKEPNGSEGNFFIRKKNQRTMDSLQKEKKTRKKEVKPLNYITQKRLKELICFQTGKKRGTTTAGFVPSRAREVGKKGELHLRRKKAGQGPICVWRVRVAEKVVGGEESWQWPAREKGKRNH